MRTGIDIYENEIVDQYPGVLEILLRDHSTQQNIFWATDNYDHLGQNYQFNDQILPEAITGDNGSIIMPRVHKDKLLQLSRSKEMAEVFTPSWLCNEQNNIIDEAWFGRSEVFNKEIVNPEGSKAWETNLEFVQFPKGKTWESYVNELRLEIACGEAPYITSRYDSTTGKFIPVEKRIGIIDRKLRIINENVSKSGNWLKAAQTAYMSTYAYEWQGDSLLLAREALLATFIENYIAKFKKEPLLKSIKYIAYIISWNVWQMDGINGVVPESCTTEIRVTENLFGDTEKVSSQCKGCENGNIKDHNGTFCIIMDWSKKDSASGRNGKRVKFIDLLND